MNDVVHIYCLVDPRNEEVRYVGKTFDMQDRLAGHLCEKDTTHKANWIAQLKRHELKPRIEALESFIGVSDEVWQEAERFWIETLRFYGCRLTNLESGGMGGKRLSPLTKSKISEKRMGIVYSESTRKAMSIAHKGVKLSRDRVKKIISSRAWYRPSEVTRGKIAESLKGHCVSDATREKLRLANLGKKLGPASQARKDKLRARFIGKPLSKEHCKKLSEAQLRLSAERKRQSLERTNDGRV